jgi:hypothetical protein
MLSQFFPRFFVKNMYVITKILTLAPGDSLFKLPPHVDGGGLERWSDPNYREVPGSMGDRGFPSFSSIHSLLLLTLMHMYCV